MSPLGIPRIPWSRQKLGKQLVIEILVVTEDLLDRNEVARCLQLFTLQLVLNSNFLIFPGLVGLREEEWVLINFVVSSVSL